jgi:NADH:ubiquinone oxidoreductase subunit E
MEELNVEVGSTTEDRRFSLEAVRCLGACGLAPIVMVDDDAHGDVSPGKILDISESYE